MSFFSVGGNAGFALGPVVATPLVLAFGLPGTLFLALPAALMAAVLFFEIPRMLRFAPEDAGNGGEERDPAPEHWGPFSRMIGVVAVRSFVYFGLVAFVASYYERVLGTSPAFGNTALTVMLFGGAAGTLVMGPLADRFGRRAVVAASMLALPPLILGFTLSGPYVGMALARPDRRRHRGDLRRHRRHGAGIPPRPHRARGRRHDGTLHRFGRGRCALARPPGRQVGSADRDAGGGRPSSSSASFSP
jgi:MFS family permease